mmetsp:Transcript_29538/g.54222  ORF Transcript_29538/g.54222 Transcript_29538/m.54222 type:complete len:206 (+) Transcript_29538:3059-3676(+)
MTSRVIDILDASQAVHKWVDELSSSVSLGSTLVRMLSCTVSMAAALSSKEEMERPAASSRTTVSTRVWIRRKSFETESIIADCSSIAASRCASSRPKASRSTEGGWAKNNPASAFKALQRVAKSATLTTKLSKDRRQASAQVRSRAVDTKSESTRRLSLWRGGGRTVSCKTCKAVVRPSNRATCAVRWRAKRASKAAWLSRLLRK